MSETVLMQEPTAEELASRRQYHGAFVCFSFPVLESFLQMPAGMRITGVTSDPYYPGKAIVKIQDERLPPTSEAMPMPELQPVITDKGAYLSLDWNAQGFMPGTSPTIVVKPKEVAALLRKALGYIYRLGEPVGRLAEFPKRLREIANVLDPDFSETT